MLNERFIELLSRKLSSELNAEELEEFMRIMADDVSCRLQYDAIKNYWKQKDDHYANSELMLGKIKQRLVINAKSEQLPVFGTPVKKVLLFTEERRSNFDIIALYIWHL